MEYPNVKVWLFAPMVSGSLVIERMPGMGVTLGAMPDALGLTLADSETPVSVADAAVLLGCSVDAVRDAAGRFSVVLDDDGTGQEKEA